MRPRPGSVRLCADLLALPHDLLSLPPGSLGLALANQSRRYGEYSLLVPVAGTTAPGNAPVIGVPVLPLEHISTRRPVPCRIWPNEYVGMFRRLMAHFASRMQGSKRDASHTHSLRVLWPGNGHAPDIHPDHCWGCDPVVWQEHVPACCRLGPPGAAPRASGPSVSRASFRAWAASTQHGQSRSRGSWTSSERMMSHWDVSPGQRRLIPGGPGFEQGDRDRA